ncbi:MAG: hypothetical protein M5U01_19625 [Ardenticatenaceae bacterium]|nr:hypothetical protein [Ardenticatenaceae bacterium]
MPAIIGFPRVVEEVLSQYREVFGTEAARRHVAEYLTGLMIAEHKTVSGHALSIPSGKLVARSDERSTVVVSRDRQACSG